MKITSFAKKAAVATLLTGVAIAANAATYALGTITVGGAPASFNAFHSGSGLVAFDDDFTFSITSPGITGGSVVSFSAFPLFGAEFTGANLYAGTPVPMPGAPLATATGTLTSLSFANTATPIGSYFFRVTGASPNGVSVGAAYSGSISVAAAPVPEPESYAMLLAGLGVMGAIAVRRNKRKTD